MHFCLHIISTPHMSNVRCFDDVALPLYYALRRLGYEVEIRKNSFNPAAVNICLGANYDPDGRWTKFAENSIILNLEQLASSGYPWHKNNHYFELLKQYKVWDFSRANIDFLKERSIKADFFQLGYVPEMTRLKQCLPEKYDVLFYGAITPRRYDLLTRLAAAGIKVNCLTSAYGRERDKAISEAKIFLNIHHSRPASLEVVRLGYVLANFRSVVSELNEDTDYYPELAGSCAFAPYDKLEVEVKRLLHNEDDRRKQAREGFDIFSTISLESSLEALVGRRRVFGTGEMLIDPLPVELNVSSGNNFWHDALNVDCRAEAQADLALDFGKEIDWTSTYQTQRFGQVELQKASFKRITALDVLADVPDPAIFMKNMLYLLADDGELRLRVPYFLSHLSAGRRGYNEAYWQGQCLELLTCDPKNSFVLNHSRLLLSDYGLALKTLGHSLEKIKMLPGAVDSIFLSLFKKPLSPSSNTANADNRSFYLKPVVEWQIDFQVPDDEYFTRQKILPTPMSIRFRLLGLYLKRFRYLFNSRYSKNKGRYKDKLLSLNKEISESKNMLAIYGL